MPQEIQDADERDLAQGTLVDLAFAYPRIWGDLQRDTEAENNPPEERWVFSILDAANRHPTGDPATITFFVRPYDERTRRYEEVCDNVESLCDRTIQMDLLKQRDDTTREANAVIAGFPAVSEEEYDVSSGYIIRTYRFFTNNHRILLTVDYDIGDLYTKEYDERNAAEFEVSLSELVAEDLGADYENPVANIVRLFPEHTKDMVRFFQQADSMIASMRTTE